MSRTSPTRQIEYDETRQIGRCHVCRINYSWPRKERIPLSRAACPDCGGTIDRTTGYRLGKWRFVESMKLLPRGTA